MQRTFHSLLHRRAWCNQMYRRCQKFRWGRGRRPGSGWRCCTFQAHRLYKRCCLRWRECTFRRHSRSMQSGQRRSGTCQSHKPCIRCATSDDVRNGGGACSGEVTRRKVPHLEPRLTAIIPASQVRHLDISLCFARSTPSSARYVPAGQRVQERGPLVSESAFLLYLPAGQIV